MKVTVTLAVAALSLLAYAAPAPAPDAEHKFDYYKPAYRVAATGTATGGAIAAKRTPKAERDFDYYKPAYHVAATGTATGGAFVAKRTAKAEPNFDYYKAGHNMVASGTATGGAIAAKRTPTADDEASVKARRSNLANFYKNHHHAVAGEGAFAFAKEQHYNPVGAAQATGTATPDTPTKREEVFDEVEKREARPEPAAAFFPAGGAQKDGRSPKRVAAFDYFGNGDFHKVAVNPAAATGTGTPIVRPRFAY